MENSTIVSKSLKHLFWKIKKKSPTKIWQEGPIYGSYSANRETNRNNKHFSTMMESSKIFLIYY